MGQAAAKAWISPLTLLGSPYQQPGPATMASTRNDDVYDMEEEFARELAAVAADSLSDSDDYSGPGYADWNNKEDDNSEGRWGGDNGGEQLASLVALKQRLAEEDGKLKVFSEILQELQLQPEWTAPGLSNEALPQTRTVGEKGMGHPKEQSEEEERVIQPGSSAQAEHRRPASVSSQGSVRLRATEESERFKAWREFEAAERQRSSAREAARRQAEAQAEEERRQLEEEAARRAAELEASTARRVAELEAAAAEEEARARREIEAEAKEEARAREAEAEAAAAAALAAEERNRQAAMREAAREEKARIVLERQLDIARRAVAAHRIWRRWRRCAPPWALRGVTLLSIPCHCPLSGPALLSPSFCPRLAVLGAVQPLLGLLGSNNVPIWFILPSLPLCNSCFVPNCFPSPCLPIRPRFHSIIHIPRFSYLIGSHVRQPVRFVWH